MNKLSTLALALLVVCFFFACGGGGETETEEQAAKTPETTPAATGAYQSMAVTDGGTISGQVTFSGPVPEMKKLEVTKDVNVCGKTEHYDRSIVVSENRGLANVVVKITEISQGKEMGSGEYVLDQNGCEFKPHVVMVPAGVELKIKNSDGILHNIHTYGSQENSVNKAQPGFQKTIQHTFPKPEIVRVACDVHNWMTGYIVVKGHPYYAVTDESGNYELTDVPPGAYTLEFWQENLGKQTMEVTVEAGAAAEANTEYSVGS